MKNTDFYPLTIKQIQTTGQTAKVIWFEIPPTLASLFSFQAGQYLTLEVEVQGQTLRRAYSLCSAPHQGWAIAVKPVKNGLVSNYLCQNLQVGQTLQVMPPQGRFSLEAKLENKADYFFIAGGSGITPLLSLSQHLLEDEPKSKIALLYANRNEEQIMFYDEIQALSKRYQGQIEVEYLLSQPKTEKKGGLFGLFSKSISTWSGLTGRLNAQILARFLQKHRSEDQRPASYWLCGPEGMMQTAQQVLQQLGIQEFHQESFGSKLQTPSPQTSPSKNALVKAHFNGQTAEVQLQDQETVLQGLMRSGFPAPFSCLNGSCSTCACQIKSGQAQMDRCLALSKKEIEQGFILACQARPSSDSLEVNFDV